MRQQQSKEEGRKEERVQIALDMLAENIDIRFIANFTKLSLDEIEALRYMEK